MQEWAALRKECSPRKLEALTAVLVDPELAELLVPTDHFLETPLFPVALFYVKNIQAAKVTAPEHQKIMGIPVFVCVDGDMSNVVHVPCQRCPGR